MKWFYTPNPDADIPVMLIDKHIGKDENGEEGIMGDKFLRELFALEGLGKTDVEVWVNSSGGSVLDGWNIYSGILNSRLNIKTVNIGIAASTAGWIFEAGKQRVMMDYSIMMMHNPHGEDNSGMEEITESIAIMLSSKSNKSYDDIRAYMEATTFMTADEAYNAGLCDEIKASITESEIHEFNKLSNVIDKWEVANTIINKLLPKDNKMTKAKTINDDKMLHKHNDDDVAKHDNMDDKHNDDADDKHNDMCHDDDDADDKKNDMDDKKNDYDDLMKKYDDLMKKYKEMSDSFETLKKEREAAVRTKADDDASHLVNSAIELGKISNESATEWKNTIGKIGLESAKKLIENLPVNRKSPVNNSGATAVNKVQTVPIDVASWRASLTNKK